MGNQTQDDRKPNQQGSDSRTGGQDPNRERSQPGRSSSSGASQEQTSQQAQYQSDGSDLSQGAEGEGRDNNSIEGVADDDGAGRERAAGGRTGQAGERDDDDIERADTQEKSDRAAPGSRPR